jgi:hypothetical protein
MGRHLGGPRDEIALAGPPDLALRALKRRIVIADLH